MSVSALGRLKNHNVPHLYPNFTMFMLLSKLQLRMYAFSGKFNVCSKCILLSKIKICHDTFGKWCRCLHNVCYVKLKKCRYLDKCRLSAPVGSTVGEEPPILHVWEHLVLLTIKQRRTDKVETAPYTTKDSGMPPRLSAPETLIPLPIEGALSPHVVLVIETMRLLKLTSKSVIKFN